jgi:hypothetical protein
MHQIVVERRACSSHDRQGGRLLAARGLVVMLAAAVGLAACKPAVRPAPTPIPTEVTPFSSGTPGGPGGPYPGAWHVEGAEKFRKPSLYRMVDDAGVTVAEGTADASASGLVEFVDIDPQARPILTWRWKITVPVQGANTTQRSGDDAPARIMLSFAGDVQSLPFADRLWFNQVKLISGIQIPYATLEYVWGAGAPVGTVVVNSYTSRIRTLLVRNTPEPLHQWVTEMRDVVEDFRHAFGEEPGRITAVSVYTDGDATGQRSQGYYGDLTFLTRAEARARGQ